jgi:hypothetical protein
MPGSPGSMPAAYERWQYIFRPSENKARDSLRRGSAGPETDVMGVALCKDLIDFC